MSIRERRPPALPQLNYCVNAIRSNVVRLAPQVRKALDNLPSGDIRPKKPFLRVA